MRARQLGIALAVIVLIASGTYVVVYLYRWEWTRAEFALLLFLAAEVALLGVMVLGRLERHPAPMDPRVLGQLRESAPPPGKPFSWLSPRDGELPVFVPILMATGVLLAAVAWLVERIAGRTAVPAMERGLARRLGSLSLPDSLLAAGDDPQALLLPTSTRT